MIEREIERKRERDRQKDREKEQEGRQVMSKLWAEEVPSGKSESSVSVNTMTISLQVSIRRQSDITKKNNMGKNSCKNVPLIQGFGCPQMQERTA